MLYASCIYRYDIKFVYCLWYCGIVEHLITHPAPQPILDSKEFTYIVLAYWYNQDVIIIVIYYDGMYCAKLYTFCKTGTHSVDFKGIKIILSPLTTRLRPKVPITTQSICAMIRVNMYEVYEHVFSKWKIWYLHYIPPRSLLTNPFVRRGDDHRPCTWKVYLSPTYAYFKLLLKRRERCFKIKFIKVKKMSIIFWRIFTFC